MSSSENQRGLCFCAHRMTWSLQAVLSRLRVEPNRPIERGVRASERENSGDRRARAKHALRQTFVELEHAAKRPG